MGKRSTIQFDIELDDNQVPEKIHWQAEGSEKEGKNLTKAVMLAFWDEEENNTLRIDLWNMDMMVDEMKKFTCQNIITLADTFERATGETESAKAIREFGQGLAKKLQVLR
jgi:gliding motility-associated protein GldC